MNEKCKNCKHKGIEYSPVFKKPYDDDYQTGCSKGYYPFSCENFERRRK